MLNTGNSILGRIWVWEWLFDLKYASFLLHFYTKSFKKLVQLFDFKGKCVYQRLSQALLLFLTFYSTGPSLKQSYDLNKLCNTNV